MPMKLGQNAKLVYRSAGTWASPTWTEIALVNELEVSGQWDTTDAPDRSTVVKGYAKTQLDLSFTASIKNKGQSNAVYAAVIAALNSNIANMDVMVLDGPLTENGASGYRFDAIVSKGGQNQGTQQALYLDTEWKPDGFSDNQPRSVLIVAGVPAFTAI